MTPILNYDEGDDRQGQLKYMIRSACGPYQVLSSNKFFAIIDNSQLALELASQDLLIFAWIVIANHYCKQNDYLPM